MGLLWDGVTTHRIRSTTVTTLGVHPMWQVVYVLSLVSALYPLYQGDTSGRLHFTELKWFAQTLPASQRQSRNLNPE